MSNGEFDALIDRRGTGSVKWDLVEKLYGSPEVLPLWVADMDFPAPGPVIRALTERVEHPVYGYTAEDPGVVSAVVNRMTRLYGWSVKSDSLIFMPGVVPSMATAIRAFSEPGDGVVLMPPVYPPFFSMIREAGRTIVENPLVQDDDGEWRIDLEDLDRKARDARMLLLCSPHNPVGRVWSREELEQVADIAERHNLIVVSDEIHGEIIYPENEQIPFASLNELTAGRTVTCIAASKTFNVAGLATSVTIIGDPALRRSFKSTLGTVTGHPNLFGLTALEAAFSSCDPWLDELMTYLDRNRRKTAEFFRTECPGVRCNVPEATFLSWLDCRELNMSDAELAEFFAREARVGLNPGRSFGTGGQGFMRLNFGCPASILDEALSRVGDALNRL